MDAKMIALIPKHHTILNIYNLGSFNYGTFNDKSDRDYICVVDDSEEMESSEINQDNINVQIYPFSEFKRHLDDHKIEFVEAIQKPIIEKVKPNFNFDLVKARHSFSLKASMSYVKAKKKLIVENEFYVAKKSLFHAMRIMEYGIQMCKNNGHIVDWNMKSLYDDVMKLPDDITAWPQWDTTFRKQYNGLCTAFRKLAPKE